MGVHRKASALLGGWVAAVACGSGVLLDSGGWWGSGDMDYLSLLYCSHLSYASIEGGEGRHVSSWKMKRRDESNLSTIDSHDYVETTLGVLMILVLTFDFCYPWVGHQPHFMLTVVLPFCCVLNDIRLPLMWEDISHLNAI